MANRTNQGSIHGLSQWYACSGGNGATATPALPARTVKAKRRAAEDVRGDMAAVAVEARLKKREECKRSERDS